jgi:hypothetical protein
MTPKQPNILPEALRIAAYSNSRRLATVGGRADHTFSDAHQHPEFPKPADVWRQRLTRPVFAACVSTAGRMAPPARRNKRLTCPETAGSLQSSHCDRVK